MGKFPLGHSIHVSRICPQQGGFLHAVWTATGVLHTHTHTHTHTTFVHLKEIERTAGNSGKLDHEKTYTTKTMV